MISLTAETHLPQVRLRRSNRPDFVFQGVMLANRAIRRKNGGERHTVALYKTRVGKYVLATTVTTLSKYERASAEILCFSCMGDVHHYLNSEHPAPSAVVEALICEAARGDWKGEAHPPGWNCPTEPGKDQENDILPCGF
jgi:hypothetical protein